MKKYLIVIVMVCCIIACKNDTQKLADLINQIIGRKIEMPPYSKAQILGIPTPIVDSLFRKNKIIIYTPPLLCTSCNLDCLEEWKIYINELKKYKDICFVFIFSLRDENELTNTLKEFDFNYPVIYDTNDIFIQKNQILANPVFYTLLVNKDNQIIMVGNPIGNESLWKLYKQQIQLLSQ